MVKRIVSLLVTLLLFGVSGIGLVGAAPAIWKRMTYAIYPGTQAQATQMGVYYHVWSAVNANEAGAVFVATWDGVSSCVVVTKGTLDVSPLSTVNLNYAGWPTVGC